MNWYNFMFSEKNWHRLRRHLVFWLLWWIYFTTSYYHYEQAGLQKVEFEPWGFPFIIKSVLLLSIHAIACYYFINYLVPKYLFTKKYAALVAQIFALTCLILLSSYILHEVVFPLVDNAFDNNPVIPNQNILWTSIASGVLSAPKIISAAVAVKLLKRWYLKQKEKEQLEKEKLITDLQLLKAQIHPEFLFSSLDELFLLAQKKDTAKASTLLLRLADILSYVLYECENAFVPLEKEIKTIRDYLVLQKIRMGNRLELDITEREDFGSIRIVPLLLFPFIESSFSCIDNKRLERNWINVQFQIDDEKFEMKLIHGKATESCTSPSTEDALNKTIKRLDFFYAGNYELKTTVEPEIMMTYLKISLDKALNKKGDKMHTHEPLNYAAV